MGAVYIERERRDKWRIQKARQREEGSSIYRERDGWRMQRETERGTGKRV